MKGRKNPYIKYLKQPVTMRLDRDTVSYFKSMSEETGIPYQTLINLYLRDCAVNQRKLHMKWHHENADHDASHWPEGSRGFTCQLFSSSSIYPDFNYYPAPLPASELAVMRIKQLWKKYP
jgi:hypothetical protein